ncbi:GW domain-containing glycosaminoglycan-binding protein [Listeria aquatica]|uniref:GW domain-containing glycosaminoglycan-binding protein n=1 Tax=Listeria aquatica TaxID=1494960 RepID=A0A841ZSK1_9LIST|nr:GW dipeptide domain-containing protein [Listeria aquatica]MBC1521581.1 GW domain-containing glycosaminoglycan-binding protein [Listeria aquatica]
MKKILGVILLFTFTLTLIDGPATFAHAMSNNEKILSSKNVNYGAIISTTNDGVYTTPYNTPACKFLGMSSKYLTQYIDVQEEKTTERATYVKFSISGKVVGFIDKRALRSPEKILSTKSVNYDAKITRATDGIFTRPYKTANYKRLTSSKTYLNRDVRVLEEIKTERATYVKFSIGGKVIGYIDKNGLKLYESIRSTKSVKYGAIINTTTDGVFTAPYNTYGFKQLGFSSKYLTQYVDVSEEKITPRATYVKFSQNGKVIGYVDKRALVSPEKVLSTKSVNYHAVISSKYDGVFTAPYRTVGYKKLGTSNNYFSRAVTVTEEKRTSRATYVRFSYSGKNIGYVDKRALRIGEQAIASSPTAKKTSQILTVVGSGANATITYWEKAYGVWNTKFTVNGHVGKQGIGKASETKSYTPKGSYKLGFSFGTSNPGSLSTFRKITNKSYWISTVNSAYYNTWREFKVSSADEHLASYKTQYQYARVINYNTSPVIKGAGSAFFLHVDNGKPTAGCVSIPKSAMIRVLKETGNNAYIINVNNANEIVKY